MVKRLNYFALNAAEMPREVFVHITETSTKLVEGSQCPTRNNSFITWKKLKRIWVQRVH
jgi:hypothetical protein